MERLFAALHVNRANQKLLRNVNVPSPTVVTERVNARLIADCVIECTGKER